MTARPGSCRLDVHPRSPLLIQPLVAVQEVDMLRRSLIVSSLLMLLALPAFAQPSSEIVLTVMETGLGQWIFDGSGTQPTMVAPGQSLSFSWIADAGTATVTDYRYGWDVVDPADPEDPGWAIDWQPDVVSAPTRSFQTGTHSFVVEAEDDMGRLTVGTILITVDPNVAAKPMSWGELKTGW
jgi:hypothetical protein